MSQLSASDHERIAALKSVLSAGFRRNDLAALVLALVIVELLFALDSCGNLNRFVRDELTTAALAFAIRMRILTVLEFSESGPVYHVISY
jgi:hypothetical protein